jgi:hypothetical protein
MPTNLTTVVAFLVCVNSNNNNNNNNKRARRDQQTADEFCVVKLGSGWPEQHRN